MTNTLKICPNIFEERLNLFDMDLLTIVLKKIQSPIKKILQIQKAHEHPTRKEIEGMLAINVLQKLQYNNDSL